jgi:hypothetical protein
MGAGYIDSSCRKTMALKLKTDCGQTRGQYPAPPPRMHLVGASLMGAK